MGSDIAAMLGLMALLCFFASIASASVLSSGAGVAGYGLSMFTPTCCYACLNSFWAHGLPCSQNDQNQSFFTSSPRCRASNTVYLESLAWCMKLKCPDEGVSDVKIASTWTKVVGDDAGVGQWQRYLVQQPSTEFVAIGGANISQPGLVNSEMYEHSRDTLLSYSTQEASHETYSIILVVASVGFAALIGTKLGLNRLILRTFHGRTRSPSIIKKHLLLPALFGKRHMRTLPWNLGYIPQRSTSVMIIIFIVVNVLFNFLNVPSFMNDVWYVSDSSLYISNLANRLGVLALANLALAILLSGRSSVLIYMTGCSRTTLIAYHRWAGRVAAIKGIAHGAIYLSSTDKYGVKIFTPAGALSYIGCEDPYWTMGIVSLAVFGVILLSSLAPIRIPWYEAFLITHVAFAVAGLVTLWYHLKFRFHGQYGYEVWLYIAFATWTLDRLVRVIRIVCLNYGLCTGRTPRALIELLPGDDFIKITAYPSTSWSVRPGQYCFVYFPTLTWFWESHPFSIASWSAGGVAMGSGGPKGIASVRTNDRAADREYQLSEELPPKSISSGLSLNDTPSTNASLSFAIRPCSGITKRLRASFISEKRTLSIPVLLEGPYGGCSADVFASKTIIAFAGGVGITGVLGYIHAYVGMSQTSNASRINRKVFRAEVFTLYWLARSRREIDAISTLLPDPTMMLEFGVKLHVFPSDERNDRIDFEEEIDKNQHNEYADKNLTVLSCGPPMMSDEIRKCVAQVEGRNGKSVTFVEEAFAW